MTDLVFAVRDVKADAFVGGLIVVPARGLVVRSFADLCNDPTSDFGKYPGDFHLYELGTWSRLDGKLVEREGGALDLGSGLTFVRRDVVPLKVEREA